MNLWQSRRTEKRKWRKKKRHLYCATRPHRISFLLAAYETEDTTCYPKVALSAAVKAVPPQKRLLGVCGQDHIGHLRKQDFRD